MVAVEDPARWGGLVDLAPAPGARERRRVAAVLSGSCGEDQVAVRASGVLARRLRRAEPPRAPAWQPRGTVLVTGGTGGVGVNRGLLLSSMGVKAFAERASRELLATGAHVRPRNADPLGELTAQERLIAAKVAAGATSKEVAAMLFRSPRTIDTHLRNVYRKIGISSRRQLRDLPL